MAEPAVKIAEGTTEAATPTSTAETPTDYVSREEFESLARELAALKEDHDGHRKATSKRMGKIESRMTFIAGGLAVAGGVGWAIFDKVFGK